MSYEDSLTTICRQFTDEAVTETEAVSEGHINDTYFVRTAAGRYVLQRLQPKMDPEKLRFNFELYSKICESAGWAYPKWMRCKDGTYFHTDSFGRRWRMYPYIEAETLKAPLTKEQLFACGKGLAILHGFLQELPAEPKPVYPMLHDLGVYYERYRTTLSGNNLCEKNRVPEIEEQIQQGIARFLPCGHMAERKAAENDDNPPKTAGREDIQPGAAANNVRIIHGDAKLSNILFRNGAVIGMLDWDTVMAGSASEELADCIRSCCVNRGTFDREAAEVIVEGYRNGMAESAENGLSETVKSVTGMIETGEPKSVVSDLPRAFDKINFELALRYYTDVISKDKTFKEKYPGYRLTRVRELLGVTWR
ncbi:MAG: aminoglycoside phosphotransferase family protein [Lachnospiraceae bacterium]|nr:aminoglycoside phosphotransferase family protein [Lachnospiraceae bacterium]